MTHTPRTRAGGIAGIPGRALGQVDGLLSADDSDVALSPRQEQS